jgi:hypothetical protein
MAVYRLFRIHNTAILCFSYRFVTPQRCRLDSHRTASSHSRTLEYVEEMLFVNL